jgi:hypothetical protein
MRLFFFSGASNVIVFDLCLDPLQIDFDIQCANNVFFYAQAPSFLSLWLCPVRLVI